MRKPDGFDKAMADQRIKALEDELSRVRARASDPQLFGKIKPCPFCDGPITARVSYKYVVFECQDCHVQMVREEEQSDAIEAWNRRAQ